MVALMVAIGRWWFEPLPLARIAWLRTFFYCFVFVDVLLTSSWVARHGAVSTDLYDPLLVGRVLPLPQPTRSVVLTTGIVLLGAAVIAATNRLPRLAGTVVAAAYFVWMVIAFSYGKVDHDRFAFLVALCVLPTVGQAHWSDREETEAAGWAIRSIQIAVVLAYFLAAFAKFRFGGLNWATGATLARALLRKGNGISQQLFEMQAVLRHSVRNRRIRTVVAAIARTRSGGLFVLDPGAALSRGDLLDNFDHLPAARRLPARIPSARAA